ncbi:MAG: twin-arginine translocase TatA/TatE family subunit [Flavobacteriales bacterium]|nr:twin-arginine translocase TatA/TatE family subunit [Flavobacteriales bacterium]
MHILLLFDISGGEILVVILFVLMFFGSKNIPELMRGLGRGIREFKNATQSIQREIQESADKAKGQLSLPLDQQLEEMDNEIRKIEEDIRKDHSSK